MNETNNKPSIKEKIITITLSLLTGGLYLVMKMMKEEKEKSLK